MRVSHTVDRLERDFMGIPVKVTTRMAKAVRKNAEQGNRVTARIAKKSAGAHGKHYSKSFSAEAITPLEWEYGPDSAEKQGGMAFETGSRNQPPHLDMEKGLDIQAPKFHKDTGDALDGLL